MRVCDVLVDIVSNMDRGTCQWEMMRERERQKVKDRHAKAGGKYHLARGNSEKNNLLDGGTDEKKRHVQAHLGMWVEAFAF